HERAAQWELWHRKLGHLSERRMKHILKYNLLRDAPRRPGKLKRPCKVCTVAKMRNHPATGRMPRHLTNATHVLQHLAADLCGPLDDEAICTRSRYLLTIVDTYSRRIFTLTLRSKGEKGQA